MELLSTASLVQEWMKQSGLSQAAASKRLGLATPWLRRFLAGDITHLRTRTIRRLATVLELPEPIIRLAMLSDQARALGVELDAALAAARGSGYLDLVSGAKSAVLELRAAPVVLPPLPPVSHEDWTDLGGRLTQRQKLAVLMLIRNPRFQ